MLFAKLFSELILFSLYGIGFKIGTSIRGIGLFHKVSGLLGAFSLRIRLLIFLSLHTINMYFLLSII